MPASVGPGTTTPPIVTETSGSTAGNWCGSLPKISRPAVSIVTRIPMVTPVFVSTDASGKKRSITRPSSTARTAPVARPTIAAGT